MLGLGCGGESLKSTIPLLFALVLLAPAGSDAETVLTEDFELPTTENFITFDAPSSIVTATNTWEVTVSGVDLFDDFARPEAVAFDGGQAIDLAGSPGAGVMSTSFATSPGQTYELIFHYARNYLNEAPAAGALVEVIGSTTVLSAQISHSSPDFSLQTLFQQQFIADASTCTLRFTSLESGDAGITIDAISIVSVEPVGVFPYAEGQPSQNREASSSRLRQPAPP